MTTMARSSRVCAICGAVTQINELTSTNAFGYADLDFRPPEMQRSTMSCWVQRCPQCGYVAGDIGKPTELVDEIHQILRSKDYNSCGGISFRTQLGKLFYRQYVLLSAQKKKNAVYAIHSAAWCCDDDRDEENARKCRLLALEMIPASVLEEDTKESNIFALIRADLLRRTGQFEEVISDYSDVHFTGDKAFDSIAKYQVELSKNRDANCHTVGDAIARFPVA